MARTTKGFTLIEMAVVVLLAGILLSFGVAMLSAHLDNTAHALTAKRQEALRDALVAYLLQNKRLPCPDDPAASAPNIAFDGIEDRANATAGPPPVPNVATSCARSFGTVPYLTLGLTREAAQDGWNNLLSYHVSTTPYNLAVTGSFNAGSRGAVSVSTRTNAGALSAVTTTAAAILISHGKNGLGAYTIRGSRNSLPTAIDELENTDGNSVYVRRDLSDNTAMAGGAFDDVLMVLAIEDVLGKALQYRAVRSFDEEAAVALADLSDIKSALIGYAMRNFNLPYADSDNSGHAGCPGGAAANDGVADLGCHAGNVPWVTLSTAANDPWALSAPPAAVAVTNRYRYRVSPALATTIDKASFLAASGSIAVNNESGAALVLDAPFVVYSLGRNNVAFFNNAAGNGAACTSVAPAAPTTPVAPACLGTNEVNNRAGNAPFVKAPLTVPPFTNPQAGYDDLVEYVSKSVIDAKLP